MGESTFPNPHDKDIRQVEEGLGKRAVYDSTNQAWKLPTGKNAAVGEWIWVNGQIGQATAAIVGGTDAIVEGTNWTEDTDGALNALNSNMVKYVFYTQTTSQFGDITVPVNLSRVLGVFVKYQFAFAVRSYDGFKVYALNGSGSSETANPVKSKSVDVAVAYF